MRLELWLKDCSEPRIYKDVINVFQEGNLVCIEDQFRILKYPINNVFRIIEFKNE